MAAYTTEQEQIELIRDWFKKYGFSIIAGIIIALVLSFGWRYWQQYRMQKVAEASTLYEQMMLANKNSQEQQFNTAANDLIKKFPQTTYANLAGLMLASQAIAQGNLSMAAQQLQAIIDQGVNEPIKKIAKIRLARIFIAQNKPQDALNLLSGIMTNDSYMPAAQIIRGDAYMALQQKNNAKIAYQNALNHLPTTTSVRSIVQMKLDEIS